MKENTENFYIEGFLPQDAEELIKKEIERNSSSTKEICEVSVGLSP